MQTASLSKNSRTGRAMLCLFILIALTGASAPMAAAKAVLDFDGDGMTDYVVVRRRTELLPTPTMEWYVLLSSGGFMAQQFGVASTLVDRVMPEDYDGDGKCDIAVYRLGANPLILYYLASESNTVQAKQLDGFKHADMTQDYDGDGKADPAQARLDSNGFYLVWRILESRTGQIRSVEFGKNQDVPLRGDYDGDGKADLAIYRKHLGWPYPNTFFYLRSSDGVVQSEVFGNYETDDIISGDFDGDRKTDVAIWRRRFPAADVGFWYWRESSTGVDRALHFGTAGQDSPIPGDYDGDGKTDHAVSRRDQTPDPTIGRTIFYVNYSTGGMAAVHWGNQFDNTMTSLFAP